jgi:hypothetical protein
MRILQLTLRTVNGKQDEYRAAWAALREHAAALDVRAWMFHARDDATRFIEFLEWKGAAHPEIDRSLQPHLNGLEQFGKGLTEQWVEP